MKKLFYGMAALALLLSSCESDQNPALEQQEAQIDMSDFYAYTDEGSDETSKKSGKAQFKSCHTMVMLNKQLDQNPSVYQKMYDIEYHTRKLIAAKKPDGAGNGGGNNGGGGVTPFEGAIVIPVYVHIIYNTAQENLSLSQINSQIDVLNKDFTATNSDYNNIPSEFAGVSGNPNITFTLAGVTRTQNSKTSWPINNTMKYASYGGHDVISPETHLNIWVVNIFDGNQTLGFAYLPGTAPTGADGVVIASPYFGDSIGTAGSIYPEFGLGRTTTHEVGHYLNLRHIWGDGRCRQDDLVSDTPSSDRPNYNCPTTAYHCNSNDMFMNYMDYVDDACMYMYSDGQVDRMRAVFASNGPRAAMVGN